MRFDEVPGAEISFECVIKCRAPRGFPKYVCEALEMNCKQLNAKKLRFER